MTEEADSKCCGSHHKAITRIGEHQAKSKAEQKRKDQRRLELAVHGVCIRAKHALERLNDTRIGKADGRLVAGQRLFKLIRHVHVVKHSLNTCLLVSGAPCRKNGTVHRAAKVMLLLFSQKLRVHDIRKNFHLVGMLSERSQATLQACKLEFKLCALLVRTVEHRLGGSLNARQLHNHKADLGKRTNGRLALVTMYHDSGIQTLRVLALNVHHSVAIRNGLHHSRTRGLCGEYAKKIAGLGIAIIVQRLLPTDIGRVSLHFCQLRITCLGQRLLVLDKALSLVNGLVAIISMLSGNVESTIVIFVVIVLNAILGTVQYVKAEKSLDSLKALSSPHAKVLRNGTKTEILSKGIVPGDILLLEAGDMVAADGRILKNYSLQVNESSLTGESTNVDKKEGILEQEIPLADRINMVYSGTLVTYGRAEVLVTGTGMDTEMGKIAQLMNATQEKKTPLQVSLDDFSKKLAILIIGICVLVFGLQLYQGQEILDSLMFAVALAVAAIPEALSSIVTIVQAMGTQKMAEDNAIIKELKAVESLGCVNVICSDKTGTLTQNKMTVTDVFIDGTCMKPEEMDMHNQVHRYMLYNAVLNNDSIIQDGREIGDPTEA